MFNINPINTATGAVNLIGAGCRALGNIVSVALTRLAFLRSCLKLSLVKIGCPFFGNYYDRIDRYVYLGAIPLTGLGMRQELERLGVHKTLTFLEQWEKDGCGIFNVYRPLEDDNHHHIEAEDHIALSVDQINQGVAFIENAVTLRQKIYVHCKAGFGRSATCVAAYLAKNDNTSSNATEAVEVACRELKRLRPGVNIKPERKLRIEQYLASIGKFD